MGVISTVLLLIEASTTSSSRLVTSGTSIESSKGPTRSIQDLSPSELEATAGTLEPEKKQYTN